MLSIPHYYPDFSPITSLPNLYMPPKIYNSVVFKDNSRDLFSWATQITLITKNCHKYYLKDCLHQKLFSLMCTSHNAIAQPVGLVFLLLLDLLLSLTCLQNAK